MFSNKVVLCFDEEFTSNQARDWLWTYNQSSEYVLTFSNELPNLLFVFQFETEDLAETKRFLLAASPLKVGETFATVNDFSADFNPCNQEDFRHLVTVKIVQGSSELFNFIKFMACIIGIKFMASIILM